ncbi:TPA: hypothetical protein DCF80_03620 [Candidatus Saccharibacteria bacterium]|nr:hypothetical protein [Candidatus Saccharibacteria bacterium]
MARGKNRHGSTGQGISEAVMDDMIFPELTLRAADITSGDLIEKLEAIRHNKRDRMKALGRLLHDDTPDWEALNDPTVSEWYAELYVEWANRLRIVARDHLGQLALAYSHLIFEPAQGVLLDEKRGFHPHTTWSNTTPDNAKRQLADIGFAGDVTTLGIVRAYTTRHGDGPFVTEDTALDAPLYEYFNGTGPWQGHFRIGHFDAVAHRYAAQAAGSLDGLVVTGVDRVTALDNWQVCTGYKVPNEGDKESFFQFDSDGIGRDITLARYGDKLHMKRLTELLFRTAPVYETLEKPTDEQVIKTIEHELGMRVLIASYGPTLEDKIERPI